MTKLPKVLTREPLVDAVFELRMKGSQSLADILPGFLFHELENPKPTLERLPAAEIPHPMRARDPNLQFAPVLRLDWGKYFIAVGDANVVISCKLPYPKWPQFKTTILDVVKRLSNIELSGHVERYSVKYVNLIEAASFADQLKKIRLEINLGDMQVNSDFMTLRVQRIEDDIVHILSLANGAQATLLNGKVLHGAMVDVDSIRGVSPISIGEFSASLEKGLEGLRQANKEKFFGCLTEATIQEMGPVYE